jgi:hypothetical protein
MNNDVTSILSAIEQGDPRASEQLLPLVYDELRRLAAQKLAQEKPGQTLQATALVHEGLGGVRRAWRCQIKGLGGVRSKGLAVSDHISKGLAVSDQRAWRCQIKRAWRCQIIFRSSPKYDLAPGPPSW